MKKHIFVSYLSTAAEEVTTTCLCLFQLRYTDILFTEQEVCA